MKVEPSREDELSTRKLSTLPIILADRSSLVSLAAILETANLTENCIETLLRGSGDTEKRGVGSPDKDAFDFGQ